MSAKHTPGPWTLEQFGDGGFSIDASRHDNGRYCVIAAREDWPTYAETSKANGYLIAAAPDLLEALETLLASFDSEIHNEHDGTSWLAERLAEADHARAAIAKARGEA